MIIVEGSADPQGKELPGEAITLVDPIKASNEKVTIKQNYRFLNCSQDGRLLFFDEITPREAIAGLYAYDRGSRRFALVLPEAYRTRLHEPLSPDGRVILAKSGTPLRQVSLPDGRTVEVIPSRINTRYTLLGWVSEGYKLEITRPARNFPNGFPNSVTIVFDVVTRAWHPLKLEGNGGPNFVTQLGPFQGPAIDLFLVPAADSGPCS